MLVVPANNHNKFTYKPSFSPSEHTIPYTVFI